MGDETVRIEGLGRLARTLKKAEGDVDDLKQAHQDASRIVLAASRPPRRTGKLADTGRVGKAAKKASVIWGSAKVQYAGVQHYGWPARGIRANPWATSAAEVSRPVWLAAYERDLQRILDEVEGD